MRKVERRIAQGTIAPSVVETIAANVDRRRNENWRDIRAHFITPEKPIGLEGFLHEVGL